MGKDGYDYAIRHLRALKREGVRIDDWVIEAIERNVREIRAELDRLKGIVEANAALHKDARDVAEKAWNAARDCTEPHPGWCWHPTYGSFEEWWQGYLGCRVAGRPLPETPEFE